MDNETWTQMSDQEKLDWLLGAVQGLVDHLKATASNRAAWSVRAHDASAETILGQSPFRQAGAQYAEEQIRKRAYELWEQSGQGNAEEHWLRAEQELHKRWRRTLRQAVPKSSARNGTGGRPDLAEHLRPFYESLLREPAPDKHWHLLVEIALGPDDRFKEIIAGREPR
jgi:hypothetical protein